MFLSKIKLLYILDNIGVSSARFNLRVENNSKNKRCKVDIAIRFRLIRCGRSEDRKGWRMSRKNNLRKMKKKRNTTKMKLMATKRRRKKVLILRIKERKVKRTQKLPLNSAQGPKLKMLDKMRKIQSNN
jgi:hypothetical protein